MFQKSAGKSVNVVATVPSLSHSRSRLIVLALLALAALTLALVFAMTKKAAQKPRGCEPVGESDWNAWSQCSAPCAPGGTQVRTRGLQSLPQDGGALCDPNDLVQTRPCNQNTSCGGDCVPDSPENYAWSACPTCIAPNTPFERWKVVPPIRNAGVGGKDCEYGQVFYSEPCSTSGVPECHEPVDCSISSQPYKQTTCSAHCGAGFYTAYFSVSVAPAFGGRECQWDELVQQLPCAAPFECFSDCDTFAPYNALGSTILNWAAETQCDAACGPGLQYFSREPLYTGDPCPLFYSQSCQLASCTSVSNGTCDAPPVPLVEALCYMKCAGFGLPPQPMASSDGVYCPIDLSIMEAVCGDLGNGCAAPTDCSVSDWIFPPGLSCSAECDAQNPAGGTYVVSRRILAHETMGGVPCSDFILDYAVPCNNMHVVQYMEPSCSTDPSSPWYETCSKTYVNMLSTCTVQDCVLSDWVPMGNCSVPCGPGGTQDMLRTISVFPSGGGKLCPQDYADYHTVTSCTYCDATPIPEVMLMRLEDATFGSQSILSSCSAANSQYGGYWRDALDDLVASYGFSYATMEQLQAAQSVGAQWSDPYQIPFQPGNGWALFQDSQATGAAIMQDFMRADNLQTQPGGVFVASVLPNQPWNSDPFTNSSATTNGVTCVYTKYAWVVGPRPPPNATAYDGVPVASYSGFSLYPYYFPLHQAYLASASGGGLGSGGPTAGAPTRVFYSGTTIGGSTQEVTYCKIFKPSTYVKGSFIESVDNGATFYTLDVDFMDCVDGSTGQPPCISDVDGTIGPFASMSDFPLCHIEHLPSTNNGPEVLGPRNGVGIGYYSGTMLGDTNTPLFTCFQNPLSYVTDPLYVNNNGWSMSTQNPCTDGVRRPGQDFSSNYCCYSLDGSVGPHPTADNFPNCHYQSLSDASGGVGGGSGGSGGGGLGSGASPNWDNFFVSSARTTTSWPLQPEEMMYLKDISLQHAFYNDIPLNFFSSMSFAAQCFPGGIRNALLADYTRSFGDMAPEFGPLHSYNLNGEVRFGSVQDNTDPTSCWIENLNGAQNSLTQVPCNQQQDFGNTPGMYVMGIRPKSLTTELQDCLASYNLGLDSFSGAPNLSNLGNLWASPQTETFAITNLSGATSWPVLDAFVRTSAQAQALDWRWATADDLVAAYGLGAQSALATTPGSANLLYTGYYAAFDTNNNRIPSAIADILQPSAQSGGVGDVSGVFFQTGSSNVAWVVGRKPPSASHIQASNVTVMGSPLAVSVSVLPFYVPLDAAQNTTRWSQWAYQDSGALPNCDNAPLNEQWTAATCPLCPWLPWAQFDQLCDGPGMPQCWTPCSGNDGSGMQTSSRLGLFTGAIPPGANCDPFAPFPNGAYRLRACDNNNNSSCPVYDGSACGGRGLCDFAASPPTCTCFSEQYGGNACQLTCPVASASGLFCDGLGQCDASTDFSCLCKTDSFSQWAFMGSTCEIGGVCVVYANQSTLDSSGIALPSGGNTDGLLLAGAQKMLGYVVHDEHFTHQHCRALSALPPQVMPGSVFVPGVANGSTPAPLAGFQTRIDLPDITVSYKGDLQPGYVNSKDMLGFAVDSDGVTASTLPMFQALSASIFDALQQKSASPPTQTLMGWFGLQSADFGSTMFYPARTPFVWPSDGTDGAALQISYTQALPELCHFYTASSIDAQPETFGSKTMLDALGLFSTYGGARIATEDDMRAAFKNSFSHCDKFGTSGGWFVNEGPPVLSCSGLLVYSEFNYGGDFTCRDTVSGLATTDMWGYHAICNNSSNFSWQSSGIFVVMPRPPNNQQPFAGSGWWLSPYQNLMTASGTSVGPQTEHWAFGTPNRFNVPPGGGSVTNFAASNESIMFGSSFPQQTMWR